MIRAHSTKKKVWAERREKEKSSFGDVIGLQIYIPPDFGNPVRVRLGFSNSFGDRETLTETREC